MSYQVLARKWRPHNFTEIVGQEHVVKSLINALQHDRLHHAYLFTGTRGVGKTTLARILAKALNCENLSDNNPCGKCTVCRDLDQGRFLDLIEVDAASRTRVEDTRELLDNAQYAPNSGKYKIYIIDEVHMLSGHSFNALLKTLEEPPAHVKFLLATTDPKKIPVTVLSRCLQFNLKRLRPDQICSQMQFILGQEETEFEDSALRLLARAADGSMRDGLSLLDQAIVFGNGKVQADDVRGMLGTIAQQPVDDLLHALAEQDASKLLSRIAEIAEFSPDFTDVLRQIVQVLHHTALVQVVPEAAMHEDNIEMIRALAALFSAEDLQLYYQIGLMGQRDLELAFDPRGGFEMVMLRMLAFKPANTEPQVSSSPHVSQAKKSSLTKSGTDHQSVTADFDAPQEKNVPRDGDHWAGIIETMKISGMTRELANNCVLDVIDDKTCSLLLDPGHKQLNAPKTKDKLEQALRNYYDRPLKLTIRIKNSENDLDTPAVQINLERMNKQKAAEQAIESDENIQALKDKFEARVIPGTIEPVIDNET